ncbi:hypothetical protein RRF57_003747 [Xylaria bambusicola]|uniref:Uncharacterized protein n=1 Tax=Xylaria bambusicola TaxID=326684 RepID=A0AAN7UFK2_9PEZI
MNSPRYVKASIDKNLQGSLGNVKPHALAMSNDWWVINLDGVKNPPALVYFEVSEDVLCDAY